MRNKLIIIILITSAVLSMITATNYVDDDNPYEGKVSTFITGSNQYKA